MNPFTNPNLGRALRWIRDRRGRRQQEVANTVGITQAMLSAYEIGKQYPSLQTLGNILDAFDADLSDLHEALLITGALPSPPSTRHRSP